MNLQDILGKALANVPGGQPGSGGGNPLHSMLGQALGGGRGLGSLVQAFQQKGLGDIVGSWIGKGQNLPISPEQLSHALGRDSLASMAEGAGLSPDALSQMLSRYLPDAVDQMTPDGTLPEEVVMPEAQGSWR